MHSAAERLLSEFGGLMVDIDGPGVSRARTPFELDPTLARGEEDRFSEWGEEMGESVLRQGGDPRLVHVEEAGGDGVLGVEIGAEHRRRPEVMRALYKLVEDEADREICTAMGIEGFFVDLARQDEVPVSVIGTSLGVDCGPQEYDDVELRVLGSDGAPMGYYYIGRVEVVEVHRSESASGATDVELSLFGYSCPYPGAGEIWRRWASGRPVELGEWRKIAPELHASWLHVVQTAWFASGRGATWYGPESRYVLNGGNLANISSFYCALGEAVNGPGGYFGSNPSALDDCLSPRWPSDTPFQLVWRGFAEDEKNIDKDELGYVLAAFQDAGVEVIRA